MYGSSIELNDVILPGRESRVLDNIIASELEPGAFEGYLDLKNTYLSARKAGRDAPSDVIRELRSILSHSGVASFVFTEDWVVNRDDVAVTEMLGVSPKGLQNIQSLTGDGSPLRHLHVGAGNGFLMDELASPDWIQVGYALGIAHPLRGLLRNLLSEEPVSNYRHPLVDPEFLRLVRKEGLSGQDLAGAIVGLIDEEDSGELSPGERLRFLEILEHKILRGLKEDKFGVKRDHLDSEPNSLKIVLERPDQIFEDEESWCFSWEFEHDTSIALTRRQRETARFYKREPTTFLGRLFLPFKATDFREHIDVYPFEHFIVGKFEDFGNMLRREAFQLITDCKALSHLEDQELGRAVTTLLRGLS